MKMVAAAKLRRAQTQAEAARPYAERLERMLSSLANAAVGGNGPQLLTGTGKQDVHLLVVVTSDRGLCGGFNGILIREVKKQIAKLRDKGREVKIMIVGRKGVALLRREFGSAICEIYEEINKPSPIYEGANRVADNIMTMFEAGEFDVCTVYYNKYISVMTQEPSPLQLIPFAAGDDTAEEQSVNGASAVYEYEPDEERILAALLPKNLSIQVFRTFLESFASEQASRMTAMDNATRNAGEMIDKLSVTYNRSRQAQITSELIEIISGAEAV
jgi:F-type H+-transporting ATPase subunit gamma